MKLAAEESERAQPTVKEAVESFMAKIYANEHEPVHVHGKFQGRESRAEIIALTFDSRPRNNDYPLCEPVA